MSLECVATIPPAPSTTRGEPSVLSGWTGPPRGDKAPRLVYGNGPNVYLRKLDNPMECMIVHRNKHPVTVAVPSPSGSYCAAGDKDGNVVVFALDNPDNTVKIEKKVTSGQINDIAWSGDNARLIAVGDGKEGFASAFALDGGNTIGDIIGHSQAVMGCDFRKERPYRIATAGSDSVFNWFEGPPFKFKHAKPREGAVNCVRFSPDGSVCASAGGDKKIVLHDGKTGEPNGELPAPHKGTIYQLSFSGDGKQMLSSSADKSCKLWDVAEKTVLKTFQHENDKDFMQVSCAFVADNMVSLGLNGDVNMYVGEEIKVLRGHQAKVNCITLGPDGKVATTGSDNAVILWDSLCKDPFGSKRAKGKKPHGSMVTGAAFAGGALVTGGMDDTICVTNLESGEMTQPGKVSGGVLGMASVADAVFVATGKGVTILDPAGAEKGLQKTDYTPQCIAAHAGKSLVAVGAKEKKIVIYAVKGAALEVAGEITGLSSAVTCVAFSADGSRLASCGQSKELGVYDTDARTAVDCGLDGAFHTAKLCTVSFSPGGGRLLSGSVDAKLIIWDLAGKAKLAEKNGAHFGGVQCSVWPSDDEVLTGGADGAIRAWKIA